MAFFDSFAKEFDGADIAANLDERGGKIDTGSYILNAALSGSLYGGVSDVKITAFAGEEATGKTFFVLGILKAFLDANEDAGVVYFDSEFAVDKELIESRGIDPKRVIIFRVNTVEEMRTAAINVLDKYRDVKKKPKMIVVLDSLGNLSTSKEMADTAEGKETKDMTKAQVIKAMFRVLTGKFAAAKVPFLVTNHTYAKIGSFTGGQEISGGSGLKYCGSTIAALSKAKDRNSAGEVEGNFITVTMYKSRFSKENTKSKVRLSYETGLDRYYGLLDLGAKYDVVKKVGKKWTFPNGEAAFENAIYKNPTKWFTDEIMAQLEECAVAEYAYGKHGEPSDVDDDVDFLDDEALEDDEV